MAPKSELATLMRKLRSIKYAEKLRKGGSLPRKDVQKFLSLIEQPYELGIMADEIVARAEEVLQRYSECLSESDRQGFAEMSDFLPSISRELKQNLAEGRFAGAVSSSLRLADWALMWVEWVMGRPAATGAKVRIGMKAGRDSAERRHVERHKKWLAILNAHADLKKKSIRAQAAYISRETGAPASTIRKFLAKLHIDRPA